MLFFLPCVYHLRKVHNTESKIIIFYTCTVVYVMPIALEYVGNKTLRGLITKLEIQFADNQMTTNSNQLLPPFLIIRCFRYCNIDYIHTKMIECTH